MEERVKKFKSIFYGLDRAYGQYKSDGQLVNGKAGGKAFILKKPVTDQLWIDHIEGKDPSLGIIPIRDNSTCTWGCIDIDTYPLDHKKIVRKIRDLELPLVMCRSKSGGAHVFIFLKEPVQAKLVRDKLQEWAGELGYANCEIFPKQIEIQADRGDTGNFLNLPYHGGDDSMRHGFSDDGSGASLDGFFSLYDTYCTTEKDLKEFKVKRKNEIELNDGPPCLSTLMSQGIPPGGRDNTLYQYAVYAKKKWPDDWSAKIEEFNYKYMESPLPAQQVLKTIKQHEKKDYQYKCKDQPMCAVCSLNICKGKQYGVGNTFEHQVSDLTKYESDESTWFLNIDGRRLKLSTDQLYDQHKFRRACMNEINVMPNMMRPNDWDSRLQSLLDNVEVIQMPHEITKTGRFESLLERFLEDQGEAEHVDEIDMGKALFEQRDYTDKIKDDKGEREITVKKMTAYFKSEWLQKFLKRNDFKDFSTTEMAAHIRNKLGGGDTRRKIKGKTAYLWFVPWIRKNSDEFSTPDMGEETPF
jgi:hypothetical protein